MKTDSSIHCSHLLTADGWIDNAVVQLDEYGLITAMNKGSAADAAKSLSGHVIPGMPNLHSHAFQRQMAGLSCGFTKREDSFWTWREAMYHLAQNLTPGQMQAIAAWLYVEMLQSGFTSCAEFHYLHHQTGGEPYDNIAEMSARLVEAATTSGIALTLLPVLYCHSGFSRERVSVRQLRFFNTPDGFLELYTACSELLHGQPLHRLGLALHSLRAVSGEQLDHVLQRVGNSAASIHIHIAEQPGEVEECLQFLGARPLAWLLEHQDIDQRWCLVHATHLDDEEIRQAAATGAIAGLCPTTEADLGDGVFEMGQWLAAGGSFGIGSDSNLRLSVDEELRWLENEARLLSGRRNVLARDGLSCGRFLYEQAARGGGCALGQPVGKIQMDYRADLVELDEQHPLLEGKEGDTVLDTFVFAGDRSMIRSVYVAGKLVIEQGRHAQQDDLANGFRKTMKELADI